MLWGLSQSHVAGLGPGQALLPASNTSTLAACCSASPPCTGLFTKQEQRSRRPGRRCATLAGHRRGRWQERAHAGPSEGGGGQVPSCSRDSSHPSPLSRQQAHGVLRSSGTFQLLSPLNWATFKASTYGPVLPKGPANTGLPSRHCWLGQGPTALVQLICQPFVSVQSTSLGLVCLKTMPITRGSCRSCSLCHANSAMESPLFKYLL